MKKISLRISDDFHQKIADYAKKDGHSINEEVKMSLMLFLGMPEENRKHLPENKLKYYFETLSSMQEELINIKISLPRSDDKELKELLCNLLDEIIKVKTLLKTNNANSKKE